MNDRIAVGMINNWKYILETSFNGTLTYPRFLNALAINNYTYLTQQFIPSNIFNRQLLNSEELINDEFMFYFRSNRPHYIKLNLTNLGCDNNILVYAHDCDFKIKFEDTNNTVIIGYNYSENEFYLDRSKSIKINTYFNDVHLHKGKFKRILNEDKLEIEIILDVNTIEFLTDQGIVSITALHLNRKIFKTLTLQTNSKYKIDLKINYSK